MTHHEKWQRIEQIDAELARLDAEWERLAQEKNDLLMTRASDETKYRTHRQNAYVDRESGRIVHET